MTLFHVFPLVDVAAATNHLREYYIKFRFKMTEKDWPPYQPKEYTPLELSYEKKNDAASNLKYENNANTINNMTSVPCNPHINYDKSTTKNMTELFETSKPSLILIEGAPGMGKTVLTKEIAFQWAKHELLNSKNLVFLIFKNTFKIDSLESLLYCIFRKDHLVLSVNEYLVATKGKSLTIIIDGYDENFGECENGSLLADIICRKILPNCSLIITSCPTASVLHSFADTKVNILGFAEEDKLHYIQRSLQYSPEKVLILQEVLLLNHHINKLCCIPLNMTILVHCFIAEKLPKTQTEMFKLLILVTVLRFIKNNVAGFCANDVVGIEDLPHPYKQTLNKIARLAHDALFDNKKEFTVSDICSREIPNGLGLLSTNAYFNPKNFTQDVSVSFIHCFIQEYLAACHISLLPNSAQFELLKETFWNTQYFNVWVFYSGITHGKNVAFKQFLSGKWFTMAETWFVMAANDFMQAAFFPNTWSVKISDIILKDKIKCLHLLHCFAETDNGDMITLLKNLFNGEIIDFSMQALTIHDINTLGIILATTCHNHWKVLDLSNCSISNHNFRSLSRMVAGSGNRYSLSIDQVDLSYNDLDFSSLTSITDLIKYWNISEIYIKDDKPISRGTEVFQRLENQFLFSSNNRLSLFLMGTFLCIRQAQHMSFAAALNTTDTVEQLCIIQCQLGSKIEDFQHLIHLIQKQKISAIHVIDGTSLNEYFLTKVIQNNQIKHCFIYGVKNGLNINSLFRSKSIDFGIKLVVGNDSVEGKITTDNLRMFLSKFEILNLLVSIRLLLCHFEMPEKRAWKSNFLYVGDESKFIIDAFVEVLHKTNDKCQLSMAFIENRTMIAYRVKLDDITHKLLLGPLMKIKTIYISNCYLENVEYKDIVAKLKWRCLSSFTIFAGNKLEIDDLRWVCTELLEHNSALSELFIHTSNEVGDVSSVAQDLLPSSEVSAVIVTKDAFVGYRPNTKQISLAFQLEPFITTAKLFNSEIHNVTFFQIVSLLTCTPKCWLKLDFGNCAFGDAECNLLHSCITQKGSGVTVKAVTISLQKLTSSLSHFVDILGFSKVEKLIIHDSSHSVCQSFIKRLENMMITNKCEYEVQLTVYWNDMTFCFFYKAKLSQLLGILPKSASTLYVIKCSLFLGFDEIHVIDNLSKLSKMVLIENVMDTHLMLSIIYGLSDFGKNLEVLLHITNYNEAASIINMKTTVMVKPNLSLIVFGGQHLLVLSATYAQISIFSRIMVQSFTWLYKFQNIAFLKLVSKICSCSQTGTRLILFQKDSKAEKESRQMSEIPLSLPSIHVSFCSNITELKFHNCQLTEQEISLLTHVLSVSIKLEEIGFRKSYLQEEDIVKISSAVHHVSKLKFVDFSYNFITNKAVNGIANMLLNNIHLQDLHLCGCHLEDVGIIKITKALSNTSTLLHLDISYNNITDIAADHVASTLSLNRKIRYLNLGNNNLQTSGTLKIIEAIKHSSDLAYFDISCNDDIGGAANEIATLVSCTNLQSLCLKKDNFQVAGIIEIMEALKHISTLSKLHLGYNNITEKAADSIATVIFHNSALTELDLSGNNLKTIGVKKIMRALSNTSTLIKLYLGDNHITKEAAVDIANVISKNKNLQELDLSRNYLQSLGAITILRSLQNISTLYKLSISKNNITAEAADDIAMVLSCNLKLRELDISNNALNIGAAKVFKSLNAALLKLNISNNNISEFAADGISDALSSSIMLEHLNLGNNDFQVNGIRKIVKAMKSSSKLISLDLSCNYIVDEVAKDLAEVLCNNVGLQELKLSSNELSTEGIKIITSTFRDLQLIKAIDLSCNNIKDEAADSIAFSIQSCIISLEELDLSGNNFQRGVTNIIGPLRNTRLLRTFIINDCHITEQDVGCIAAMISHTKLQQLCLSRNCFQGSGVIEILRSLEDVNTLNTLCLNKSYITTETADLVAACLSHNLRLQSLDLGGNDLQGIGTIKISNSLKYTSTLTELNISNNNITQIAADDLAAVLNCNTRLESLYLYKNDLKAGGIIKIANAIKNLSALITLDLGYNKMTSKPAEHLGSAFCSTLNLQNLDLSGNSLESLGATIICCHLQCVPVIQTINLSNNDIAETAASDIAASLVSWSTLKKLDLGGNNLRASGTLRIANALESMSMLETLVLNDNHITVEVGRSLQVAIECGTYLQEVDLSSSSLSTASVIEIAKGLRNIITLTKLNLSDNEINHDAVHAVATALFHNRNLLELSMSRNNLGSKGFIKLARGLQNMHKLKKLDISWNNVTDKAAKSIANVLKHNTHLQELNLGNNKLETRGVTIISKVLGNTCMELMKLDFSSNNITVEAASEIAAALSCKTNLHELKLCGNFLTSSGVAETVNALMHNQLLKKLDVSSNSITDVAADAIAVLLQQNTLLEELCLNNNKLKTDGAIKIFRALQHNHVLKRCDISANGITHLAADCITNVLGHTNQLKALCVDGNNFKSLGIIKIATALEKISTLKILSLSHNNFEDDAVDNIVKILCHNSKLEQLYLSGNNLKSSEAIKIINLLHSVAIFSVSIDDITDTEANSIAEALSYNNKLTQFYITGEKLSASAVGIIAKGIITIPTLTIFDVISDVITAQEATEIILILSPNSKLQVCIKWK